MVIIWLLWCFFSNAGNALLCESELLQREGMGPASVLQSGQRCPLQWVPWTENCDEKKRKEDLTPRKGSVLFSLRPWVMELVGWHQSWCEHVHSTHASKINGIFNRGSKDVSMGLVLLLWVLVISLSLWNVFEMVNKEENTDANPNISQSTTKVVVVVSLWGDTKQHSGFSCRWVIDVLNDFSP